MRRPFRGGSLGVLFFLLTCVGCATSGGVLKGMADWSTLVGGNGSVVARVVNDSSEAITVRIQDEQDKVIAQAPLGPHDTEKLSLTVGSVHATVRVMRDGRAAYSEPQAFQVAADGKPIEWHFSPPSIE